MISGECPSPCTCAGARADAGADVGAAVDVEALASIGVNSLVSREIPAARGGKDATAMALAASRDVLRIVRAGSESHIDTVLRSAAVIDAAIDALRTRNVIASDSR